jgi:hypothetical protein
MDRTNVDKNEKTLILSKGGKVLTEGSEPEKGSVFCRLH